MWNRIYYRTDSGIASTLGQGDRVNRKFGPQKKKKKKIWTKKNKTKQNKEILEKFLPKLGKGGNIRKGNIGKKGLHRAPVDW